MLTEIDRFMTSCAFKRFNKAISQGIYCEGFDGDNIIYMRWTILLVLHSAQPSNLVSMCTYMIRKKRLVVRERVYSKPSKSFGASTADCQKQRYANDL